MSAFTSMVRTFTMVIVAAMVVAGGTAHAAPDPKCPTLEAGWARDVEIVEALRAYKGADGESHIEKISLPGKHGSFYGGSVKLTQFGLGDPSNVVIVYGYPNIEIPAHPAPYREIFIIVSGSSELYLPNGEVHALSPGSMLIAEDMGTKGRAGRAGPCGYVAIDLQFKPDTAAK